MKKAINLTKVIKANSDNHLKLKSDLSNIHDERHVAALNAYKAAEEPILAEIAAVEGKASVRRLTVTEIIDSIESLERNLNIAKKDMVGIKAHVDVNAQAFPNAYKFTPMSTTFEVEYRKNGWYLTGICRSKCKKNKYDVTLTPEAEKAILEHYRRW